MWEGRTIVLCAAAFLLGDYLGGWLYLAPWLYLSTSCAMALASALRRRWVYIYLTFALMGASAIQCGRMSSEGFGSESALSVRCAGIQAAFSSRLESMTDGAGEEEIGVLKALAIGDRSGVSRRTRADFRASGATHLLALSGLHVGIIYKLFGWLLMVLGGSPAARWTRSISTLTFLWFFALVSGMSPSIARAVVMISVYEISSLGGRRADGMNALAISAILITLINPVAPWQISFQMSFCSCLSIFTIYPRLKGLLQSGLHLINYIWNCAVLAISCQATTGVLAWLYFGTFPRFFIITNLLTVPLVGAIMYLLAAALITAPLPALSHAAITALEFCLHLLCRIAAIIASL